MSAAMKASTVMRRYLTEPEQVRLLAAAWACRDRLAQRDYWWMRLLIDTGMRIHEFALLRAGEARFALDAGWIHIPAERRKGHRAPKAERVERSAHEVRVTARVAEAIEALLRLGAEFLGAVPDDADPLVWSARRQLLSVRSYQARIAFWCGVAGLPPASPHWMRHTRAMNVIRRSTATEPLRIVQAALGHASLASTGIYTGVTKEDLADALDQVDQPKRLRRREVRRAFAKRRAA